MKIFHQISLTSKNFLKFKPLIGNLISRDLKKKYRNSVMGYVWCVLNPLLVLLILNFVFSSMFKNAITNFPVYLITGRIIWTLIQESTTAMERSLVSNGALMRKARIPYYVFPVSSLCSSVVNFAFSLIAFVIVLIFTRTPITIHAIAFPLVFLETAIFCFGLGLILAMLNVYVRDVNYIYAVLTTAWMYVTPLFYPLSSLPEGLQNGIMRLNPAYFYINQTRDIFWNHVWPQQCDIIRGTICAAAFTILGMIVYRKCRKNVILYV